MPPSDDVDTIGIPELDSAISKIREGDNLAESGERALAAGKYQEAISQLKSVRQSNEGRIREIANKLLKCAYQHGHQLVNKEPVSDVRAVEEICKEINNHEGSDTEAPDAGAKNEQESSHPRTFEDAQKEIAEGNRFRRNNEYDSAIEHYETAKEIINQQPAGIKERTLRTEIDLNLRNARGEKKPEVSPETKKVHREIREQIAKGDRLQREYEYDAAIERYQEANSIINQNLSKYSGGTLETEVDLNIRKARTKKRLAAQRVESLDDEIRQLNTDLLAQHGIEIPYHRAAISSETLDESQGVVYTPPLDLDVIDGITAYYRELRSIERQLASVSNKNGGPTAVTKLLGGILNTRHADVETDPGGERDVVDATQDVLEAYLPLLSRGDSNGTSDLETRLEEVHTDVTAGEYRVDSDYLIQWLTEIRAWAEERVRRVELQSRADDLRSRWSATAGEHLNLDIEVTEHLTASGSGEKSLSEFESEIETAERTVSLASRVRAIRGRHQTATLDRLPEAFGQYLYRDDLSSTRLDRLERTLDVVETAVESHQRYPSYPFDRVVEYVCAELENETPNRETSELITLVENATDVLDFLANLDITHPSVQPDEWQEHIHTGLENVSPEHVRPLASLVDRMGETPWERRHLYHFSWEEFEHLVASIFESQGYDTTVTQATKDEGVDIWARSGGDRIAIQVKQHDTSNRVGRPTLQQLSSTIAKNDADQVIIVTSGEFTETARDYAADFGEEMRLIDGTELIQLLTESDHPPPVTD
jgi:tetratricopeptide (TPR) repeat protein